MQTPKALNFFILYHCVNKCLFIYHYCFDKNLKFFYNLLYLLSIHPIIVPYIHNECLFIFVKSVFIRCRLCLNYFIFKQICFENYFGSHILVLNLLN
jgi:hypothetical protein